MKNPIPVSMPKKGYVPLLASEHHHSPQAKKMGKPHTDEPMEITIVLRRRLDGKPIPSFEYFADTPPSKQKRLSLDEFAANYGAHPDDIQEILDFAGETGLAVKETHAAKRTVLLTGTVALVNKAFAVELQHFQHNVIVRKGEKPRAEKYRGHQGFAHVPLKLAKIIVGIFGLDNRRITKHNSADPPGTAKITMEQIRKLYNFPNHLATGQNIAVFSEGGYTKSDIKSNFPDKMPQLVEVNINAKNDGTTDPETTQDIFMVASAAPGATIAVYFTTFDQGGWVNLINRVIHPDVNDPVCQVFSNSFYVSNSDDLELMPPFSKNWIDTVTMAFQDAAIQKVTVCCASGDNGTDSKMGDKRAHVQYPASDPWVLCVGGTTLGNIQGDTCEEYLWNDTFGNNHAGATGGGVSAYFPKPSYQAHANVPPSVNNGYAGRGIPDVAANASPNSGIPMIIGGKPDAAIGTSASSPLWAGLIATINAAIGENVGFINPLLYKMKGAGLRNIGLQGGPTDNGLAGAPGYRATAGWDACTGWGSPDGVALVDIFKKANNA